MDRPYIFCHMLTSLDGKIMGSYMDTPEGSKAGGMLNWSFIGAGLCDELSIVMAAAADGTSDTPSLFETRGGLANNTSVSFTLENAQVMGGGSVWLRYQVKH